MNDVIDSLLSPPRAKIKKDQDVNSSKFESLRELLEWFQRRITSDVYVLKVCRDEIWRCGMGFSKDAMKNTNILVKDFEVLFLLLVSKVWGYKDKSCYLHHLFPVFLFIVDFLNFQSRMENFREYFYISFSLFLQWQKKIREKWRKLCDLRNVFASKNYSYLQIYPNFFLSEVFCKIADLHINDCSYWYRLWSSADRLRIREFQVPGNP